MTSYKQEQPMSEPSEVKCGFKIGDEVLVRGHITKIGDVGTHDEGYVRVEFPAQHSWSWEKAEDVLPAWLHDTVGPLVEQTIQLREAAEWAVYALEHGSYIEVHWLHTVAKEKHAWARDVIAKTDAALQRFREGSK